MKKFLTIVISAIAFGLIAGAVMVGVNVVSTDVLGKKNIVAEVATGETIEETVKETAAPRVERQYVVSNANGANEIVDIVDQAMPSVVSITNMQKFIQYGYNPFNPYAPRQQREVEEQAAGSGVIVRITDEEVIILTNNHVIDSASSLTVTFDDNETVEAAVKGTDAARDLAIIAVKKSDVKAETLSHMKSAVLGNSDSIRVGERVVAIGNALGIGQSVTTGIVSAKNREIEGIDNATKLIQTDAAINPGNSGGALLNMHGELIGINVAKNSGNAIEGMGYAIPVNEAIVVIDTLSNRKVREAIPEEEQGYLGITARNITSQLKESLDMPEGIYVYSITKDSAAAKSDLKVGDVIVSFDDQPVKTLTQLQELLKYTHAGDEVKMKVMRRGSEGVHEEKEFTIKLGKRPVDQQQQKQQQQEQQQQQQQQQQGNGDYDYYYDPFSQFEDFFNNRGFFGW